MQITDNETTKTELRIIKTARSEQAINEAVEQGFWPLVKPVIPSPDIRVKFAVTQDKTTGKIRVVNDYRLANIPLIEPVAEFIQQPTQQDITQEAPSTLTMPKYVNPYAEEVAVIGWTYYYPYQFECPFAAYLVPIDLQVGEVVMLEDLIEDVVGNSWNQGDTYRLTSCKAVWDGNDFVLRYDPDVRAMIVG